jgi:hypothetical protein
VRFSMGVFRALEEGMSATSSDSPAWPWPDALDALMAAPAHHKLLLENERARVIEVRIPAGEFVPVHTHRWRSVVFTVSAADFVRRDAEGKLLVEHAGDTVPRAASGNRMAAAFAPAFRRECREVRNSVVDGRGEEVTAATGSE